MIRSIAIVDGKKFPVTGMYMAEGELKIEFSMPPGTGTMNGPVTFFGEDGRGVVQTASTLDTFIDSDSVAVVTCGIKILGLTKQ